MLVLASVLEVDLRKALILAKGLGVLAWLDMIKSYLIKPDLELNKIIAASQRLSGERNNIVHAYWQDSRPKSGLPSLVKSKPSDIATGLSISKKHTKLLLNHQYTPKEMRSIAAQIQELEQSLRLWEVSYKLPKKLAAALRA